MKIVAITSCPTGIAHTFMAAEALKKAREEPGPRRSRWRPRARSAPRTTLTAEEIAAADRGDHRRRHPGRYTRASPASAMYEATAEARLISDGAELMRTAIAEAQPARRATCAREQVQQAKAASRPRTARRRLQAPDDRRVLHAAVRGRRRPAHRARPSRLAASTSSRTSTRAPCGWTLFQHRRQGAAFTLMVPVLAGFIAYSIADRPGHRAGA
ncbi:MAG: hypothetical protein MZW92_18340 [Comamonadaceae bacterium]|nr:hypothetical protein [Comamonadaceae bacterium]